MGRKRGDTELSAAERAMIVGRFISGENKQQIANAMGRDVGTIGKWIKRYKKNSPDWEYSLPRSGRRPILNEEQKNEIVAEVQAVPLHERWPVNQIALKYDCSRHTINRVLKERNVPSRKPQIVECYVEQCRSKLE